MDPEPEPGRRAVRMRRDPEAVAAYREMLAERGVAVDEMSDEVVIETIERAMDGILTLGRTMVAIFEQVGAAAVRVGRSLTDLYVSVGGAQLAEEAELDLALREDVRTDLLRLNDDEEAGA